MNNATATLTTRDGRTKRVVKGDPLHCDLDGCRVRFVRLIDTNTVEVASNHDGKVLPDWRHTSQVHPY